MKMLDDTPILEADVLQPCVTVHPRTGRKSIYVSPTFTTHIDGMRPEESRSILQFVYEWFARPEFCTRVSWHPNQVVMWDNRSLSHKVSSKHSHARATHATRARERPLRAARPNLALLRLLVCAVRLSSSSSRTDS